MNITVLGLTNPDVNLKRMHQLYNVVHRCYSVVHVHVLRILSLFSCGFIAGCELIMKIATYFNCHVSFSLSHDEWPPLHARNSTTCAFEQQRDMP